MGVNVASHTRAVEQVAQHCHHLVDDNPWLYTPAMLQQVSPHHNKTFEGQNRLLTPAASTVELSKSKKLQKHHPAMHHHNSPVLHDFDQAATPCIQKRSKIHDMQLVLDRCLRAHSRQMQGRPKRRYKAVKQAQTSSWQCCTVLVASV